MHLYTHQYEVDKAHNDGCSKTEELKSLTLMASSVLCEILTTMEKLNGKQPLPRPLSPERMSRIVAIPIDNENKMYMKFAKVRFLEFLQGMRSVLRRHINKREGQKKKLGTPTSSKRLRMKQQQQQPIAPPAITSSQQMSRQVVTGKSNLYIEKKDEIHQDDKKRKQDRNGKKQRTKQSKRNKV